MKEPLEKYARLGLVHHLLYDAKVDKPEEHLRTLAGFIKRADMETLDCCLPLAEGWQDLAAQIKHCGKEHITFAAHFLPLRSRSLATTDPGEQALNRQAVELMVQQAAAMGATGFIFASGGPSPDCATPAHHAAFADFCRWLAQKLEPHGITAMLEPFDMTIDKKFLYGPTDRCAPLIESLRAEGAYLAIELDMAHVPLMGETFAQAIRNVAPYLQRVHLGNCVLRDKRHHRYGDTHPVPGIPGGEIGVEQIADILRTLLAVGYLKASTRGDLVIEIAPDAGADTETAVQHSMEMLRQAWALA